MVGRSDRILQDALTFSLNRAGRPTPFHKRLRRILDMFFPSTNLEAQLKATWFTNTVLCPAEFSGGFHDGSVERACLQRFFSPQLSLFGHAFVLVLGDKAERRMQEAGFRFEASAPHPSARKSLEDLEAAWRRAADLFRRRQKEGPQDQGSSSERVSQTESIKSDSPEHDAILQEILAELSKEHRDLFDEIACNPAFELTPMRMQLALRYNGRKVGGLNRRIERYYISKTFAPRELFAELMEEAGFEWKIKNEVHQYWEAPKAIGPSAMRMVIDKMCRHTVRR